MTPHTGMRFLLVDDHPLVRAGIGQLLLREYPDAIVDEAGSAAQALQLAASNRHALICLDLSLPDASGFDCLEALKRQRADVPVLIVSMYEESQYATRSMKAGAAGYLHKQHAGTEIIHALRCVLKDGHYLNEAYAQRLALASIHGGEGTPHDRLTEQEFRVLCLLGDGKAVGKIATELSRSVKTVSSHRANILRKMAMKTTSELVHYCIKNGLVN
jgi:two-component system, NarL family, invasion response regulator UvrY